MNEVTLKRLNTQCGWTYGPSPKDGGQYWVVSDSGEMYIANAIGTTYGWGLGIFENDIKVVAYKKITKPLFKV